MNGTLVRHAALLLAGLLGAAGVGLSALAAHGENMQFVGTAATMCLAQAPALLSLFAGWDRIRTAGLAAILIGLGCLLFAGDLLFWTAYGHGLFPMSAPTGGVMMILGWLVVGIGAFLRR